MLKWLKQLTCKHEYSLVYEFKVGWIHECKKCRKKRRV